MQGGRYSSQPPILSSSVSHSARTYSPTDASVHLPPRDSDSSLDVSTHAYSPLGDTAVVESPVPLSPNVHNIPGAFPTSPPRGKGVPRPHTLARPPYAPPPYAPPPGQTSVAGPSRDSTTQPVNEDSPPGAFFMRRRKTPHPIRPLLDRKARDGRRLQLESARAQAQAQPGSHASSSPFQSSTPSLTPSVTPPSLPIPIRVSEARARLADLQGSDPETRPPIGAPPNPSILRAPHHAVRNGGGGQSRVLLPSADITTRPSLNFRKHRLRASPALPGEPSESQAGRASRVATGLSRQIQAARNIPQDILSRLTRKPQGRHRDPHYRGEAELAVFRGPGTASQFKAFLRAQEERSSNESQRVRQGTRPRPPQVGTRDPNKPRESTSGTGQRGDRLTNHAPNASSSTIVSTEYHTASEGRTELRHSSNSDADSQSNSPETASNRHEWRRIRARVNAPRDPNFQLIESVSSPRDESAAPRSSSVSSDSDSLPRELSNIAISEVSRKGLRRHPDRLALEDLLKLFLQSQELVLSHPRNYLLGGFQEQANKFGNALLMFCAVVQENLREHVRTGETNPGELIMLGYRYRKLDSMASHYEVLLGAIENITWPFDMPYVDTYGLNLPRIAQKERDFEASQRHSSNVNPQVAEPHSSNSSNSPMPSTRPPPDPPRVARPKLPEHLKTNPTRRTDLEQVQWVHAELWAHQVGVASPELDDLVAKFWDAEMAWIDAQERLLPSQQKYFMRPWIKPPCPEHLSGQDSNRIYQDRLVPRTRPELFQCSLKLLEIARQFGDAEHIDLTPPNSEAGSSGSQERRQQIAEPGASSSSASRRRFAFARNGARLRLLQRISNATSVFSSLDSKRDSTGSSDARPSTGNNSRPGQAAASGHKERAIARPTFRSEALRRKSGEFTLDLNANPKLRQRRESRRAEQLDAKHDSTPSPEESSPRSPQSPRSPRPSPTYRRDSPNAETCANFRLRSPIDLPRPRSTSPQGNRIWIGFWEQLCEFMQPTSSPARGSPGPSPSPSWRYGMERWASEVILPPRPSDSSDAERPFAGLMPELQAPTEKTTGGRLARLIPTATNETTVWFWRALQGFYNSTEEVREYEARREKVVERKCSASESEEIKQAEAKSRKTLAEACKELVVLSARMTEEDFRDAIFARNHISNSLFTGPNLGSVNGLPETLQQRLRGLKLTCSCKICRVEFVPRSEEISQ